MLLTNEKDILRAMNKELEGASDSTIKWLAESFGVSVPKDGVSKRKRAVSPAKQQIPSVCVRVDYTSRIPQLRAELKTKTLTKAENDRNLNRLDYSGVWYGYNLKSEYPKTMKQGEEDIKTPELDRLEKLAAHKGIQ